MPHRTDSSGSTGLLTIAATATRLACSDMHVYRLIAAGQLDAVDIAQPGARKSKTRVTDASVSRYIESRIRRAPRGAAPRECAPADSGALPAA